MIGGGVENSRQLELKTVYLLKEIEKLEEDNFN